MNIQTTVDTAKSQVAYAQRRASAIAEHALAVVSTGAEATTHVATVVVEQVQSAVAAQRSVLLDSATPIRLRLVNAKAAALDSASEGKEEILAAVQEGYASVRERLARVTAVSNKEQAVENKLARKAKKAQRAAYRAKPAVAA